MLITSTRTILLYFFIIIVMRILGKRQIGQLQPAELVLTILLSEIIAIPIQDPDIPMLQTLVPTLLLIGLEILISYFSMKNMKFREILQGHSIIVIQDGKILQSSLKELRFTVDDLMEALRKKDIFDINDVENAIVETDGTFSVQKKKELLPPTKEELKIPINRNGMQCIVISDGTVLDKHFSACKLTMDQLQKILKVENISTKDVMLMTIDKSHKYSIIKKDLN